MQVLMTIPGTPGAPFDGTVAEQEGWGLFDCGSNPDGTREMQFQRIDFPEAGDPPFDSDNAAWQHVVTRARAGSELHRAALAAVDPVEPAWRHSQWRWARSAISTDEEASMAADDTTWTDTVISNLRRLWDEGHATAEIGRRLGVTKNAVIGKAHRLELPRRPSPIRQNSQTARKPGPRPKVAPPAPPLPAAPVQAVPAPPPAPLPIPAAPFRRGVSQPCCWPLGEPGRPEFRFCDAAADEGKPYCAEHRALAYVKPSQPASASRAA